MNDRFVSSFLSGMIGYLPALAIDKMATWLKLEQSDFMDFAAALAFHGKIDTLPKFLFTLWVQLLYAGLMGIGFGYIMRFATPKYYYLKGALLGAFAWFFIYAVDVIFKIPEVVTINFASAVSHHIASILWGVTTALMFRFFCANARTQ